MPQLAKKAGAALERLGHAGSGAPAAAAATSHWLPRLLGAVLLLGAASSGLAPSAETWPAWSMLAGGLYLVLRR
ncbi:hypothetical protein D3C78_1499580 [compost metagenome]